MADSAHPGTSARSAGDLVPIPGHGQTNHADLVSASHRGWTPGTAHPASNVYTLTNASPLCAALSPSSVAFTLFQLFSAFMRASQPCT